MKMDHLILKNSLLIGSGTSRKCYIHPDNPDLCIKVSHKKAFQRSAKREINYFRRLKKRGISFEMIAQYISPVQTDRGEGEIFELVRDFDGEISKSVRYYLKLNDENLNRTIIQLFEDLRQYLKKEYILFSDLDLRNILLKRVNEAEFKLIIIDGLGDNNQVPFLEFFPKLGEKRSIKKWEKFRMRWIKKVPYLEGKIKSFQEKY
jgi:hypothetical protein